MEGQVYAQPLAIPNLSGVTGCSGTCNVVFIATERDKLYAFNADTNTQLWVRDLALDAGGTFVDCSGNNAPPPCSPNNGVIGPYMGVTGTPVIDMQTNTLYVVSLVQPPPTPGNSQPQYYLNAIDIRTGSKAFPLQISASVQGPTIPPTQNCAIGTGTAGTVNFVAVDHIQRTGLLLLNHIVYVGFSRSDGGIANGWILGYSYNPSSGFSVPPLAVFNTTPFAAGGGIWESGAGLAAATNTNDGNTYIFVATGNGTFDKGLTPTSVDYGDSLLRLSVDASGGLSVSDYFTPYDQHDRCLNDTDFGSTGVMILPDSFYNAHHDLMVSADKLHKLFLVDRDALGGYNPNGNDSQIVQWIPTPNDPNARGYWANPAYWKWTDQQGHTQRAIYYSVREQDITKPPFPINMYVLSTDPNASHPIPNSYTSTTTLFCGYGATPSISANPPGTTGGILWAIEATNSQNPSKCTPGDYGAAALHAYDATNVGATELYSSRGLSTNAGGPVKFSTPTVFNGRVYTGTLGADSGGINGLVSVFGLCASQPSHHCLN